MYFLQRLMGFAACTLVGDRELPCCPPNVSCQRAPTLFLAYLSMSGYIIQFGAFFRIRDCINGDCAPFAVMYTFGNIIAVTATFFLSGPCSQVPCCHSQL